MADLTGMTTKDLCDRLHAALWDKHYGNGLDPIYARSANLELREIERRLLRAQQMERIQRIIDVYFAPWGAAKAAMWEELSGDGPFSPETALNLIRAALGERPPTPTMSREEAERIADELVKPVLDVRGMRPCDLSKRVADALQSVARGERP